MRQIQITDEWLYKYIPIVDEAIVQKLEDDTDYKYEFSSRFKQRMRHLIWAEKHSWQKSLSKIPKRIAMFFLCIICFALFLTMSVEAYRIQFFETVKTIREDSILYSYFKNTDLDKFQIYEPEYIPKGYEETERTEADTLFRVVYENSLGEMITWDQMLVLNGGNLVMDSEYDSQITKEIYGDEVIISLYSDGYIGAYYEHGEYAYLLTADNLSVKEVCHMLESMQSKR